VKKVSPKFPVVDAHTHISSDGAKAAVEMMNMVGISAMVNLTAGTVLSFKKGVAAFVNKHPGRFAACVMLDYKGIDEKDWSKKQADGLTRAVKAGISGLKEVKRLGLEVRDKRGRLVAVDDARLDPIWDRCAKLDVPVAIHVTDPLAFHKPLVLDNERFVELQVHPDWYFLKPGLPSKMEVLDALSRVMTRHCDTKFMSVHFGALPEDIVTVSHWLEEHPNMYIDLAARFVEIGRHHPEMVRNFFIRHQNRILFGTDTGISPRHRMLGVPMPSDDKFWKRDDYTESILLPYWRYMYRYLETSDYCIPPSTPVQGGWFMHGIALPDSVLKKVYSSNARKLFSALR
jgi:predicted TIM-barrel fold metal-dependent hydrolase